MLNRQEERNRKEEKNIDKEYLIKLYQEYESRIDNIYPNHIIFENNCFNQEPHVFKEECCFKDYNSMFEKLL
jgi:deoxyadenosine/deoxycytidine kinase